MKINEEWKKSEWRETAENKDWKSSEWRELGKIIIILNTSESVSKEFIHRQK